MCRSLNSLLRERTAHTEPLNDQPPLLVTLPSLPAHLVLIIKKKCLCDSRRRNTPRLCSCTSLQIV